MRKLIVVLMILVPCFAFGEETEKVPSTNIEKYMSIKGNMVIKEFYPIGNVQNAKFEALIVSDPFKSTKRKGLRVEVKEYDRIVRSNSAFIDYEELDNLSKSIAYMSDLSKQWNKENNETYTEVQFSTNGNLIIGLYTDDKKQKMFIHTGIIARTSIFTKADELDEVKKNIDAAITFLKNK